MVPHPARSLQEIENQARQLRTGHGLVASQAERTAATDLLGAGTSAPAFTQQLAQIDSGAKGQQQASIDDENFGSVQEYMDRFMRNAINHAMQVCSKVLADGLSCQCGCSPCETCRAVHFLLSLSLRRWTPHYCRAHCYSQLAAIVPPGPWRAACETQYQSMQVHIDTSNARFDAFLQRRMDARWTAARDDLLRSSMGAAAAGRHANSASGLLPAPGQPAGGTAASRRALQAPPSPEVHFFCMTLVWLLAQACLEHLLD